MVNVKEMVYQALTSIHPNVADSWPADTIDDDRIIYTEEDNKSHERCGSRTTKSYLRYRIDIFSQKSTSVLACEVDGVLAYNPEGTGLGLTRTFCQDDNNDKLRHKIMRYEGIISETDKKIYGI